MKYVTAIVVALILCLTLGANTNLSEPSQAPAMASSRQAEPMSVASQQDLLDQYCVFCHDDVEKSGGMSLSGLNLTHVEESAELAEKVIRKLRAGMMPPAGQPRPDAATLQSLAASLEGGIDTIAADNPNPGQRSLQRLNRAEYERSVEQLLDIKVDAAALLPPDSMGGGGFDNVADALTLSASLMEGYMRAASKISRVAVGDQDASPSVATYKVPRTSSQMRHVEGAPFGTRGGTSVVHNFPAAGNYVFKMEFYPTPTGSLFGAKSPDEKIEISINGERIALLDIDPRMSESRDGVQLQTEPIAVKAGPLRVSAAFIQKSVGPIDDLMRPIEHTIADSQIAAGDGITNLPHLQALGVSGPFNATGASDTPSRRKIFKCRPLSRGEEVTCATEIVTALSTQAYRRPVNPEDLEGLMTFYQESRDNGDFESGIRSALQAILTSPNFVFRFEQEPAGVAPGDSYRISNLELASRLSYFLWSTAPDDELYAAANDGKLHDPSVLRDQVRRMLTDPRAEALATRFASQWLRLQDLDGRVPDPLLYPQFDTTLGESMQRETQLLFDRIAREDRSVLELLTANYTFVDERLANHYGIPNIIGNRFRQVPVTDENRLGLLGHGSILTLTSIADRTSPVARGKWVLEVILGTPPPPPPPNVPELEVTSGTQGDKLLTLRQRQEQHRQNPFCAGCHVMIDPIGLALENFDPTGRWRELDAGNPVDAAGELFDGTKVDGPVGLREALLSKSDSFIRNFTENLMTYSLGRRVQYYDMPTVRAIARDAAKNDNRFSSFVLGIVESPAFQMRIVQPTTEEAGSGGH
jgi:hypothetical protein